MANIDGEGDEEQRLAQHRQNPHIPALPLTIFDRAGVSAGTVLTLLIQTVLVVAWLVTDHNTILSLQQTQAHYDKMLSDIDNGGSRAASLLAQKVGQLEGSQMAQDRRMDLLDQRGAENRAAVQTQELLMTKLQGSVDNANQRMGRIEEQQSRILQAIDSTYNLINEHLRNNRQEKK